MQLKGDSAVSEFINNAVGLTPSIKLEVSNLGSFSFQANTKTVSRCAPWTQINYFGNWQSSSKAVQTSLPSLSRELNIILQNRKIPINFWKQVYVTGLDGILVLLRAVASNQYLRSFALSMIECVPACDNALLHEIFENNTTLENVTWDELEGKIERLTEITDRNIFWKKQQRFKSVKLANNQ